MQFHWLSFTGSLSEHPVLQIEIALKPNLMHLSRCGSVQGYNCCGAQPAIPACSQQAQEEVRGASEATSITLGSTMEWPDHTTGALSAGKGTRCSRCSWLVWSSFHYTCSQHCSQSFTASTSMRNAGLLAQTASYTACIGTWL